MLDFNGIGIKGSEDLQEALLIETSAESFVDQFQWMVKRWGLDQSLLMLGRALFGAYDPVFPMQPIIKFKKRMVPAGPPDDPWADYNIEDIK